MKEPFRVDFIKGADVSMLDELEKHGAKYYDNGIQKDALSILHRYGINTIRLKLWKDPFDGDGNPYGGGTNDFQTTVRLARRVFQNGMSLMLDIHYSDFWTDPEKQIKPKQWKNLTGENLQRTVYQYTYRVLSSLKAYGLLPKMVQVGNELTNGLLWPDGKLPNYDGMFQLLRQGILAVRRIDPAIKIVLHLDNGGKNEQYRSWFDRAEKAGADFDMIGLSYYPYWHGTLEDLDANMNDISERYHKDVIVTETAYGFTTDSNGDNTIFTRELCKDVPYPPSPEGQKNFLQDLSARLRHVKNNRGKGFFYWEPEWIPARGVSWATKAGRLYIGDPSEGGNTWSNQALFDFSGNALPALRAMKNI